MARPRLKLEMIGVRPGDMLVYWNDDEVTCTVVQTYPALVYFEGEVISLSDAAGRASGIPSVQGAAYWTFGGELLRERRLRFEKYHVDSFDLASDGN